MAIDTYKNLMGGLESPAREAALITPCDDTAFAKPTRSIWVGIGGDLAVVIDGAPLEFKDVPIGILPVRAEKVMATGTTASDITALW